MTKMSSSIFWSQNVSFTKKSHPSWLKEEKSRLRSGTIEEFQWDSDSSKLKDKRADSSRMQFWRKSFEPTQMKKSWLVQSKILRIVHLSRLKWRRADSTRVWFCCTVHPSRPDWKRADSTRVPSWLEDIRANSKVDYRRATASFWLWFLNQICFNGSISTLNGLKTPRGHIRDENRWRRRTF